MVQRRTERAARRRDLDYFTPPAMVERATARRLAGDWRGACAAANVDVDIAPRYGREIEGDLAGFAPDLVRRFMPRRDGVLWPDSKVVLSRATELRGREPFLMLSTPARWGRPQRLRLSVATRSQLTQDWYDLPAWCWHADARVERRHAYGGSADRLPWHDADGRPYRMGETTPSDARRDRAFEVETVEALRDAGRRAEAWVAAGIAGPAPVTTGTDMWYLATEVRRLTRRYGIDEIQHGAKLTVAADGRVIAEYPRYSGRTRPRVVNGLAPVDAALLHRGDLTPGELHPLVHEALFPGTTQPARPSDAYGWPEMRVRCGRDWHLLRIAGGRIVADRHDEVELFREEVIGGLGGPLSGCGAAVRAWHTGRNPIPKQMRKIRQDVFARAFHGDTDALVAMLAAGLDPDVRDSTGGTLAHYLGHAGHDRLLPALVAAGARLDLRDRDGHTPWDRAVEIGLTEVARALADAGAGPADR